LHKGKITPYIIDILGKKSICRTVVTLHLRLFDSAYVVKVYTKYITT
jgi:hypothetical protein